MKTKTEVQQVVERYINSTNAEFINDYIKMMEWLVENEINDVDRTEAQITVVNHFLGVLDKNKIRLVDVCATRNKKVSAEVVALLDSWIAVKDEKYKKTALEIISKQTDPITIVFLYGIMQWKSREFAKQKRQAELLKYGTVDDFKVENSTSSKYQMADDAIRELQTYEVENLEEVVVAYTTVASKLAKNLTETDLKKEDQHRVFDKFKDYYLKKIRELEKEWFPEVWSLHNPMYTVYTTDIINNYQDKCMFETETDEEVEALRNKWLNAVDYQVKLHKITPQAAKSVVEVLINWKVPTPRPVKQKSNGGMVVMEVNEDFLD